MSDQIHPARVQRLNSLPAQRRTYVLYWMQQSQRAQFNHALEYAAQRANELGQPLVVCFGLTSDYPDANLRHYTFMLQGLAEVATSLRERGIAFVLRAGQPWAVAAELGRAASVIVCDRGYLRPQKQWRRELVRQAQVEVTQVEADVIVPVDEASHHAEHAARTLRPKVTRLVEAFLAELTPTPIKRPSLRLGLEGLDARRPDALLATLDVDRSVPAVRLVRGGTSAGREILSRFVADLLDDYKPNRHRSETNNVSHMSKYLHFGQISPVEVYLTVQRSRAAEVSRLSYLEELLVRRELSMNFVNFTPQYDRYSCVPAWARSTLERHAPDKRPYRYSLAQLEQSRTHDDYWNAAMREMVHTGYMHNYMRMYWGKKILEWSATPRGAYRTILRLNNKYFIDGRDANSYSNIAWIFGRHDRPWFEREVFGTVRYMAASGLERKSDPRAYVAKVDHLVAAETGRSEGTLSE